MGLRQQLGDDLKDAMRSKDQLRMDTIRGIRSAVMNKEVDAGDELDDDAIAAVIRTLVKQRTDSIEQYKSGGRDNLVQAETREKEILEAYLPAAPDADTIKKAVEDVVSEFGATNMKDMGRVMKEVRARLGPAAPGKEVSEAVKSRLA